MREESGHYASKEEATKEAARRVAAGTKPETLAIVSTDFHLGSQRWSVKTLEPRCGAGLPQPHYIDIKRLKTEKWAQLWNTIIQAVALAALGTFMLSIPLSAWFADWFVVLVCLGALISLSKYLFSVLAPKDILKPVEGFDCPYEGCRKYIATHDPWVCGHCDATNVPTRTDKYAENSRAQHWLIQSCCKCSYRPTAYLCHHCGKLIYLGTQSSGQHPARAAHKIYPEAKPVVIQEIQQVSSPDDWKAQTESQIDRMVAEKLALSTITQKACELRDAELKRIEEDETIDQFTKNQLKEFEKQWANKKLLDLKMRIFKAK